MAALDHAAAHQCDLIISHHPLVMTPEKSIDFSRMPGSAIFSCAQNQMSILSAHTNLDKADQGLNDYFAQKIGIQALEAFCPEVTDGPSQVGIGRTGRLAAPVSVKDLADRIKHRLGLPNLRVAGDMDRQVQDVALCTGSGGSLTPQFLQSSAQVYITGDLKYHEARDIESQGRAAIDVGHFASEHIVVELLKTRLENNFLAPGFRLKCWGTIKKKIHL